MICAQCGGTTSTIPCSLCGRSPLLRGRYRLERAIDRRGRHYAAVDAQSGTGFRSLLLLPCPEAKVQDAADGLERRLAPLRTASSTGLAVPGPPFAHTIAGHSAICLHAGPLRGRPIGARYGRMRATLTEQLRLLEGGLSALAAMHGLSPPMVHGAIGPGAIFVDDDGLPILLGPGVQEHGFDVPWRQPLHPDPELTPATDLYMLGVTVVAAAVGRPPWNLVDDTGVMMWNPIWPLHPLLGAYLQRLTRPAATTRPDNARLALEMLHRVRDALRSHPEAAEMLHEVLSGPLIISAEEQELAQPEPELEEETETEREHTLLPQPTPTPAAAPAPTRTTTLAVIVVAALLAALLANLVL